MKIKIAGGVTFNSLEPAVKDTMALLAPQKHLRYQGPAALGAMGGALTGALVPVDENDRDAWLMQLRNAGIGTAIGGLGGLGAGIFRSYGTKPVKYLIGEADGKPTIAGIQQQTHSLLGRLLGRAEKVRHLPVHPESALTPKLREYIQQQTGHPIDLEPV